MKSQNCSSWLPGGRHWVWGKKAVSFWWPSGGLCSVAGCRVFRQSWAEESLLGHSLGGWLCAWRIKEVKRRKKEEMLKGGRLLGNAHVIHHAAFQPKEPKNRYRRVFSIYFSCCWFSIVQVQRRQKHGSSRQTIRVLLPLLGLTSPISM